MNFKFLQQLQLLFLVLSTYAVSGQNIEEIYDGPYIDVLEDSLSVQWIEGGTLQQKMIGKDQEIEFDVPNLPYLSFEYKPEEYNKDFKFSEVSKVVALSDIHGEAPYLQYHTGNVSESELQDWSKARLLKSKMAKMMLEV